MSTTVDTGSPFIAAVRISDIQLACSASYYYLRRVVKMLNLPASRIAHMKTILLHAEIPLLARLNMIA